MEINKEFLTDFKGILLNEKKVVEHGGTEGGVACDMPDNLTLDDIKCVYTGKPDRCMCGCSGVYKYSSKSKDKEKRKEDVNDKRVMKVYNKIKDLPNLKCIKGYIYTGVVGSTQYTVYLDEEKYKGSDDLTVGYGPRESKANEAIDYEGAEDPATHDASGETAKQYESMNEDADVSEKFSDFKIVQAEYDGTANEQLFVAIEQRNDRWEGYLEKVVKEGKK